jgi:hypothetical protein
MLAKEQDHRWHHVSKGGSVVLDKLAERLETELLHHYDSEAAVETPVNQQV